MLKVYEEVSLVDHIINLYGPNIIIESAGTEQKVGLTNPAFESVDTDCETHPLPTFENVNIKKAFNQSIIQQKKLSCIYDQDKVTMAVYSLTIFHNFMDPSRKEYTAVKVRDEIFAQKREKAQQMRARLHHEVEDNLESEDDEDNSSKIVLRMGNLPDDAREDVNLVLRKHSQTRRRKLGTVTPYHDQLNTKL